MEPFLTEAEDELAVGTIGGRPESPAGTGQGRQPIGRFPSQSEAA